MITILFWICGLVSLTILLFNKWNEDDTRVLVLDAILAEEKERTVHINRKNRRQVAFKDNESSLEAYNDMEVLAVKAKEKSLMYTIPEKSVCKDATLNINVYPLTKSEKTLKKDVLEVYPAA